MKKKIPHPLFPPTDAEIERAKTDPDARKRVSVQRLRVKRRAEEIARLTAENADLRGVGVDGGDLGDLGDLGGDDYDDDRYARIYLECDSVIFHSRICDSVSSFGNSVIIIIGFVPHRTQQHS